MAMRRLATAELINSIAPVEHVEFRYERCPRPCCAQVVQEDAQDGELWFWLFLAVVALLLVGLFLCSVWQGIR